MKESILKRIEFEKEYLIKQLNEDNLRENDIILAFMSLANIIEEQTGGEC